MKSLADGLNISAIIVSYNTAYHTITLLQALQNHPLHEIIVVDNASSDHTVSKIKANFPQVILIENKTNRGFGTANNQGINRITGDIALLINSDCVPEPNAISILSQVFQDSKVIAAGGQLLNTDHTHQQSACNTLTLWSVLCEQLLLEKAFPTSKLFNPYWVSQRIIQTTSEPTPVAQVMGACLMLRPVEQFNEQFFLYCEDTELCHRLSTHGQILFVPEAKFIHALGASSNQNRWWSIALYNRGKELYFRLHHGPLKQFICILLNRLGALLRLIIKPRQAQQWLRILTTPVQGPQTPKI